MDKDTSEIAKLTERIAKDPKSKLFVPLAEEYKKIGQTDMAVAVLREGLKNNPGYATARSFLGRLLLEQNDLAGAQKELEEVVKTIPDNLLAQKKLGDIFILQGKPKEALERYRVAKSLGPVDKELTAIIEDLEAGRDVSGRIAKPKMSAPPVPVAKPAPAAAPKPATVPAAQPPKPAAAPPVPPAKPAPTAAPTVTPPPAKEAVVAAPVLEPAVEEIFEEITEAEVIEQPAPPVRPAAPVKPAPKAPAQPGAPAAAPVAETLPPLKPRSVDEPGAAAFDISEPASAAVDAGLEGEIAWSPAEAAAAPAGAAKTEASDDINTDTLAELYIAQRFYDKAIEIYQRMLADRPDNQALQQKLLKLHALAANSGVAPFPETAPAQAAPAPPIRETQPPVPPRQTAPAPPPATEPAVQAAPAEAASRKEPAGGTAGRRAETAPARPAGSSAAVRRKETIDRLESWLKNVIKEKPE